VANLSKLKSGKWRAQVARLGVRQSQSFPTKAAAQAWATMIEGDILAQRRGQTVKRTLRHALERYRDEVTPTKRGQRWERIRLDFYCGPDGLSFADKWLSDLTPDDFGRWRDLRLRGVKASTVNRDFNLLSAVLTATVKEWRWLRESPMIGVRRPKDPPPRKRLITWREVRAMLRGLGWSPTRPPVTMMEQAAHAFLVSLHTGMRAGEVLSGVQRGSVVHLAMTKNGDARDVPLSPRAQRLVAMVPRYDIAERSLDALFRKVRERLGLDGFTFHDARATALTRMARRVDVLTLARISGHRDLNVLMKAYYRETSQDVAKRLR